MEQYDDTGNSIVGGNRKGGGNSNGGDERSISGGKSISGFKAASDRLFGRKAGDGSSTLPRNLTSREKQQAAPKEAKQPLLAQMKETLAAVVLPRQQNAFMKETRASFHRKSLVQGEAEKESRPSPLIRTGSLRQPKERKTLFARSESLRQKKARAEEDSMAGNSRSVKENCRPVEESACRPLAESSRTLAESSRPLAESSRPLAESSRPLAESRRGLGTHAGSKEKIPYTKDTEGVCTAS